MDLCFAEPREGRAEACCVSRLKGVKLANRQKIRGRFWATSYLETHCEFLYYTPNKLKQILIPQHPKSE